jgi:hypothetical protein
MEGLADLCAAHLPSYQVRVNLEGGKQRMMAMAGEEKMAAQKWIVRKMALPKIKKKETDRGWRLEGKDVLSEVDREKDVDGSPCVFFFFPYCQDFFSIIL